MSDDFFILPRKNIEELHDGLVRAHGVALIINRAAASIAEDNNKYWHPGMLSIADILVEHLESLMEKHNPFYLEKYVQTLNKDNAEVEES